MTKLRWKKYVRQIQMRESREASINIKKVKIKVKT